MASRLDTIEHTWNDMASYPDSHEDADDVLDLVAVARAAEHLSDNCVVMPGDDPFKFHKALYALQDALVPLLVFEAHTSGGDPGPNDA